MLKTRTGLLRSTLHVIDGDKLRTINVIHGIDVVITEDWWDINGDIVTYTANPDEDDIDDLRMIHLRKNGTVLLAVEISEEQFNALNEALHPFYLESYHSGIEV